MADAAGSFELVGVGVATSEGLCKIFDVFVDEFDSFVAVARGFVEFGDDLVQPGSAERVA